MRGTLAQVQGPQVVYVKYVSAAPSKVAPAQARAAVILGRQGCAFCPSGCKRVKHAYDVGTGFNAAPTSMA